MKKLVRAFLITILLMVVVTAFSACNDANNNADDGDTYFVKLSSCVYDEEESKVKAVMAFTLNQSESIGTLCHLTIEKSVDAWFETYSYRYVIEDNLYDNAAAAASVILEREVAKSELEVSYNYVTIYKSFTSDGTVTKINKNYVHNWALNADEEAQLNIWLRTERREVWYAVVIGGAMVLTSVVVLSIFLYKRKNSEKNSKGNNGENNG